MEEIFSKADLIQLQGKGISLQKGEELIRFFKKEIPTIILEKSATIGDGILIFSDEERSKLCLFFDEQKEHKIIQKFVPASGAATRMFKFLTRFLSEYDLSKRSINAYLNHKKNHQLKIFLLGKKRFSFYDEINKKLIKIIPNYEHLNKNEKDYLFIKTMLSSEYFDFANKPKGILPFHIKNNKTTTPVEEHILESDFYRVSGIKNKIHFTISKEHQHYFEKITNKFKFVDVSFSYQNKSTDTLAVNLDNTPYRQQDGSLLFRPGGHGALIENLNQLEADIVFIKNIDNVSQNNIHEIVTYKKVLGGLLLQRQKEIFTHLQLLENNKIDEFQLNQIKDFVLQKLNIRLPINFEKFQIQYKIETLFNELNRPIRVCGMVKNEGEPGGGPFWVKQQNGLSSLQIVETAQISLIDEVQKKIVNQATHFNPVNLVCGIKDYKNNKFNLINFVDDNTGFVVEKSNRGAVLKSYELPGLWNGSMANWISIFVEVPLSTFDPVKTVNDLLKQAHQPQE
ncbi:DUF4301 family protein [uncultured Flavobacterium sp.]|uniref:DUF4301 family protein n=1 Tax=uncultured Flavobacterium sp. TaxID=165435 RepID=UPI0030CA4CB3